MVSSTGCIGDQGTFNNVDISGYVKAASDSSAIPGALVIVEPPGSVNTSTDSNGYYEYHRTFSTGHGDPLEILVIVTDVDGDSNGVFISQDSLIYEENTADSLNLVYEIDFYVEIVGDI